VIVAEAPFARLPRLHVTVPAACEHDPVDGVADTNEVPDGSASVICTPAALEGPPFETVTVYVKLLPAETGSGESVFVTERSAAGTTVVPAVAVLLVASGSVVVEATTALFEIEPVELGAVTLIVMAGADAPALREARVQVTTRATREQLHPVPLDETYVTPAGSVSVTVRLCASEGPAFETVSVYARD
jgi:hypothetical protein